MEVLDAIGFGVRPGMKQLAIIKEAAGNFRNELTAQCDGFMIEGGEDDPILKVIIVDHLNDFLFHAFITEHTIFQFNIGDDGRVLYKREVFFQ